MPTQIIYSAVLIVMFQVNTPQSIIPPWHPIKLIHELLPQDFYSISCPELGDYPVYLPTEYCIGYFIWR